MPALPKSASVSALLQPELPTLAVCGDIMLGLGVWGQDTQFLEFALLASHEVASVLLSQNFPPASLKLG